MRIENVKLISETEFSRLVSETYGRPYQLQQQGDMMGQDTMIRVTVPDDGKWGCIGDEERFQEWKARDVTEPMDYTERLWWLRDFYPPFNEVLDDLHRQGILPQGDYVIHVWW
jgi:hypothetical protein